VSNGAPPASNPFAAQQASLRERLSSFLTTLHPALRSDIERALSAPGKLLSQPDTTAVELSPALPAGTWPLLTLLIAQHVTPNIDMVKAGNVALAVECFVCGLDLLDDVEDEDQTSIVQELGIPRALNASTALLGLSQRLILSLRQQRVAPARVALLLQAFADCLIAAVTGQHRDLLAEQRRASDVTRDEYIEIAAGKAGAIMRLACLAGAICAGASRKVSAQFAELGMELGIAHQLDNDAHDLYDLLHRDSTHAPETGTSATYFKSDLARGKKTLPIILTAASLAKQPGKAVLSDNLDAALKNLAGLSDRENEEYRRVLDEGIVATWGTSLLYRERAHERLRKMDARKPIAAALRLLLEFEPSPRET
jgi:geranylgeranyl pyrophosphate synthase